VKLTLIRRRARRSDQPLYKKPQPEIRIVDRLKPVLLGIFASSILGGCATTPSGEVFSKLVEPKENVALLYLYRPAEYYGKALSFTAEVDGQEKGDIGNGAYMIIPLDPGKRVIQIHGFGYKDEPREVEATKGTLMFLRVATAKGFGGFSATLTLEADANSKAASDLASLRREPERYLDKDL